MIHISISTVWCLAMMAITSSPSRLQKARLSVPSGKPSRAKRDLHLITFLQMPLFSGKFPFSSTKASLRPSIIEPSMIHCWPWICCQTSSQTPLLQTDSILWCERRLLVVSASSLWCRLLLMLHIVSRVVTISTYAYHTWTNPTFSLRTPDVIMTSS